MSRRGIHGRVQLQLLHCTARMREGVRGGAQLARAWDGGQPYAAKSRVFAARAAPRHSLHSSVWVSRTVPRRSW